MGAFEELLKSAVTGDRLELAHLIAIYAPLISRQSIVNGKVDMDLKQHLVTEFISALPKFKGLQK